MTLKVIERICIGCGTRYQATGPGQKRCKPRCGWYSKRGVALKSRSHREHGLEFIGVDGEGVTDADGTHRYVLLSVGDQSLTAKDPDGRLTFLDIMPFLWDQYLEHPHAAFIGFYLSYDFSQWFKDLPLNRAQFLFTEWGRRARQAKKGNRIMPFPVRYGGWEFDMIGLRRFKLRPCPGDETHDYGNSKQGWLYISDAGPFWQTSLLQAINPKNWGNEPILTDQEWKVISDGKKQRATAKLDKDMIRYNVTENDILSRAMSRLERGFSAQGWNLPKSHWFGPGQAAQAWLRNIQAPTGDEIREKTPDVVLFAAQASYYGGWFEIPRHGHIPDETYEYDINSAYPHIISSLPCLLHGQWLPGPKQPRTYDAPIIGADMLTLCRITYIGSDTYLGGLPHRNKDGIISRPQNGQGWYWLHEVNSAIRAGLVDTFTVTESFTYSPCHCKPPLAAITTLYNERLKVGKNTPHGKALKLCYNSSYGKFAQSIGEPKYSNSIYASLITSGCRTMILDAIASHPDKSRAVLMIATDGLYLRSSHPYLPISPNTLGLWDYGTKQNLTLFMPGVYWDDKSRSSLHSDAIQLKSRGINAGDLATQIGYLDAQFAHFDKWQEWPNTTIPIRFSVTSPQLALARGKWETCGKISTFEHDGTVRELTSNPLNKRDISRGVYREDGILTTYPYSERGRNYGYNKSFGMTIEALVDNDALITDDGTVGRELVELLGNGE